MSEYEVGEHTGGAPGHPHLAVHQHLAPFSQGLVYELGDLWKMQRNVLLGHIQQFQPLVLDVEGRVISLVGIHCAISVSLGGVENMGHPQPLQVECVPRGAFVADENTREDLV